MRAQVKMANRVGVAFVGIGYALIACIAGVHFRVLLPLAAAAQASPLTSAFHRCASVFLLVELLAQYSLAVWSNPGHVGSMDRTTRTELLHGGDDSSSYDATNGFCKKCARVKPRRAHHCRVCATCVHEMDHHCPWINNCVGYNNYSASQNWIATAVATLYKVLLAAASVPLGVLLVRRAALIRAIHQGAPGAEAPQVTGSQAGAGARGPCAERGDPVLVPVDEHAGRRALWLLDVAFVPGADAADDHRVCESIEEPARSKRPAASIRFTTDWPSSSRSQAAGAQSAAPAEEERQSLGRRVRSAASAGCASTS